MPAKLIKCGRNQRQGGIVRGFGFGPTKKAAQTAARRMAQALAAAEGMPKAAALECPDRCPRKSGEGIANSRFRDLLTVQIMRGLWVSVFSLTYDIIVFCEPVEEVEVEP